MAKNFVILPMMARTVQWEKGMNMWFLRSQISSTGKPFLIKPGFIRKKLSLQLEKNPT
jgi:hypothetical protein